jgi:hypothetical protein
MEKQEEEVLRREQAMEALVVVLSCHTLALWWCQPSMALACIPRAGLNTSSDS